MNEDIITSMEDVTNEDLIEESTALLDEVTKETEKETESTEVTEKEEESSEIEMLKRELDTLRKELEEKKSAFERMSRDIGEFSELFPEKNINAIPDSVWESVKAGIPLAAAYALYERKNAIRSDMAKRANEENSARTTGSIGRDNTENFYTPDEVRAMSRAEVKHNYSKIIESMKKWN